MKGRETARAGGFSLIELLVVVGLLCMLASAAFVSVGGMVPSFRIESDARKIAAAVSNLRAEAVLSGKPHAIVYDLENASFHYLVPPEQEENVPPEPVELEDLVELRATSLSRGIVIEDVAFGERKVHRGKVKIYFGTLDPAPPHLVHLKLGADLKYTVEVNTVSGLVDVIEGHRKFDVLLTQEKYDRE
jgi:prepilin-type N-terminal cleavage/methylation domain-containing protein